MKNKKNSSKLPNIQQFDFFIPDQNSDSKLNMYSYQIPAGFPSPAEDFLEKSLDLNDYLIKNKAATFLIRVQGSSMINAGIFDGDLLVIDRSVEPVDGKIVLGVLNGEFTIKRVSIKKTKLYLVPENDKFKTIEITPEMDFKSWGVVTYAIHQVK